MSIKTKETDTSDTLAKSNGCALTSVGIFKGQLVAIKKLPQLVFSLTREDLMELKEVNRNHFIDIISSLISFLV